MAQRKFIRVLVILSMVLATAWLHHAYITRTPRRCFVMFEGNDASQIAEIIAGVREIGREASDFATLRTKLETRWKATVSCCSDYSVIHVSPPTDDTSALDTEVTIDSFVGSPTGLLKHITKKTGTQIGTQQWYAGSMIRMTATDNLTRIHVNGFHGSIRKLFAETIPRSYSTLALSVLCRRDGRLEVHHLGQNRFYDQVLADQVTETVLLAEHLTLEEQEAEGSIVRRHAGESKDEFDERLLDFVMSQLRDVGRKEQGTDK